MDVLVHADSSPFDATDDSAGVSWLRSIEAEVLLSAVGALRVAGFLTEDEYQAKRQRLTALL
ncbi:MAG TPA: hypothetical protein VMY16_15690 [Ilumatobacteraceae bacterium]|nr:hypothetical protein [Ilumatobacteraceae bacterium]